MNEQRIALLARQALDGAAEHLPWRVTHRLATAREAALAHLPRTQAASLAAPVRTPVLHPAQPVLVCGPGQGQLRAGGNGSGRPPRLGWRIAGVVVPLCIVIAGLFGISQWTSSKRADDLAAVDAAVLADEVPIAAYADRGFGVFLRNSSQADRE